MPSLGKPPGRKSEVNNMRPKSYIIISACVAALVFCGPSLAFAASKKSESPHASPSPAAKTATSPAAKAETSAETKAPRAIPFKGSATAVDQSAKTFTIAGKESSRVFKVTEKSTVTKMGATATMSDLSENEAVTGSYWKREDGTLEVKSLKIGGKSDGEKKSSAKSKKGDASADMGSAGAPPSPSPKK